MKEPGKRITSYLKGTVAFMVTVLVLFISCRPHTPPPIAPVISSANAAKTTEPTPVAEPIQTSQGNPLYSSAREALDRQDYRTAFSQVKQALSKGAPKAEGLEIRADIFKATGYLDRCIETLKEWQALKRDDLSPSHRLFFEYSQLGWRKEAEDAWKRMASLAPNDPRTLQAKALLGFRSQQPSVGIAPIAAARKLDPKNRTLFEIQLSILNAAGKGAEAEAAMRDFLKFDSLTLADQKLLLATYILQKKIPEANELVNRLVTQAPQDAEIQFQLGTLSEKKGDLKAASLAYEKAVSIDRGYGNALWKLGHSYIALGRGEEGKRLMREYEKHDKYTGNFETCLKQLESRPADPELHLKLANFHIESEELPEAVVELKRTLELRPKSQNVKPKLKEILMKQGRLTEANQIR